MLIHWPGASKLSPSSLENQNKRIETYKALIKAQKDGKVRHIGVSNFTVSHLKQFIELFPNNIPSINQFELHPLLQQKDLVKFCKDNGILVQSYSTLGQGLVF